MFGNLLGTLQRFKQDENKIKDREQKKRKIEEKIEEKTVKEREEAKKKKFELFTEREKKKHELKILEVSCFVFLDIQTIHFTTFLELYGVKMSAKKNLEDTISNEYYHLLIYIRGKWSIGDRDFTL
jgi:hypothetical protein